MSSDSKAVQGEIVRADDDVDFLAELDRRNAIIERVVNAAIKATHSGQWVDQQGKPFLTAAGAEVVALRCNVTIFDVEHIREDRSDEVGKSYIYFCTGKASLGHGPRAHTIEAVGTCSSRDQFLAAGKEQSDVDEGNIMKAAYSNFIVNAVTRVTGIRNMTWEQLKPLGISPDGAVKVTYAEGSKGGGQSKGQNSAESITVKWGDGKGKTIAQQSDKDLAFYIGRWEEELVKNDPDKAKFRKNTEMSLAAGKEELARRANAKVVEKKTAVASYWDRLKLLATQQGLSDDKLKVVTKQVLKADEKTIVNPNELTEEQFKHIADALEVVARESAKSSDKAGF